MTTVKLTLEAQRKQKQKKNKQKCLDEDRDVPAPLGVCEYGPIHPDLYHDPEKTNIEQHFCILCGNSAHSALRNACPFNARGDMRLLPVAIDEVLGVKVDYKKFNRAKSCRACLNLLLKVRLLKRHLLSVISTSQKPDPVKYVKYMESIQRNPEDERILNGDNWFPSDPNLEPRGERINPLSHILDHDYGQARPPVPTTSSNNLPNNTTPPVPIPIVIEPKEGFLEGVITPKITETGVKLEVKLQPKPVSKVEPQPATPPKDIDIRPLSSVITTTKIADYSVKTPSADHMYCTKEIPSDRAQIILDKSGVFRHPVKNSVTPKAAEHLKAFKTDKDVRSKIEKQILTDISCASNRVGSFNCGAGPSVLRTSIENMKNTDIISGCIIEMEQVMPFALDVLKTMCVSTPINKTDLKTTGTIAMMYAMAMNCRNQQLNAMQALNTLATMRYQPGPLHEVLSKSALTLTDSGRLVLLQKASQIPNLGPVKGENLKWEEKSVNDMIDRILENQRMPKPKRFVPFAVKKEPKNKEVPNRPRKKYRKKKILVYPPSTPGSEMPLTGQKRSPEKMQTGTKKKKLKSNQINNCTHNSEQSPNQGNSGEETASCNEQGSSQDASPDENHETLHQMFRSLQGLDHDEPFHDENIPEVQECSQPKPKTVKKVKRVVSKPSFHVKKVPYKVLLKAKKEPSRVSLKDGIEIYDQSVRATTPFSGISQSESAMAARALETCLEAENCLEVDTNVDHLVTDSTSYPLNIQFEDASFFKENEDYTVDDDIQIYQLFNSNQSYGSLMPDHGSSLMDNNTKQESQSDSD